MKSSLSPNQFSKPLDKGTGKPLCLEPWWIPKIDSLGFLTFNQTCERGITRTNQGKNRNLERHPPSARVPQVVLLSPVGL